MFAHTNFARFRIGRNLIFGFIATTIFLVIAAGSIAAVFSSMAPVNGSGDFQLTQINQLPSERQFAPAPEATCIPQPSGMISRWSGNGNANDIQSTNHGMLKGTATYSTGVVGQAFSFDGTEGGYVDIPDAPSLNPPGAFTADGWFYIDPAATGNANEIATFVSKSSGELTSDWAIYFDDRDQTKTLRFVLGVNVSAPNAIPTANWYHVAGTYDPAVVPHAKLYVNGNLVADSGASEFAPTHNAYSVRIGAMHWTDVYNVGNDRLNGKADEVQFLGRALSQSEIQSIYNAGSGGVCEPPTCVPQPSGISSWWPAEETPQDIIGTRHATLSNGAGYADGRVGKAFSFDGVDDYASIPAFDMGSDWTVEGWIYPIVCSDNLHCSMFARSNGNQDGLLITYVGAGHPHAGEFAFDIGNGTVWQFTLYSGTTYAFGGWHHVAAVKNGDTYALFVDGVQKAQQTITGIATSYQSTNITVGYWNYGSPAFMKGLVDELSVYSAGLSLSQIQSIYNAGSAGKCKPVATPNWSFELDPNGTVPPLTSWWENYYSFNDCGVPGTPYGSHQTYITNSRAYSGSNAVYSYVQNAGGANGCGDPNSRHTTEVLVSSAKLSTTSNTIYIWRSEISYTQTSRWSWEFSVGLSDGTVTQDVLLSCRAWGNNEGCPGNYYDNSDLARIGADGFTWYRHPITLPAGINPNAMTVKIRHYQDSWDGSTADSTLYYDLVTDIDETLVTPTATPTSTQTLTPTPTPVTSPTCIPKPSDMISWWRGEDNASDASGNNNGTLIGGTTYAPGKVGRAFSFNGTTATVDIPDNSTLDVSTEFTLAAWIDPTTIPAYPYGALVMSKVGGVSNLNGYQMTVTNISGNNVIWCSFNTSGGPWPQHIVTGGNVTAGSWTHIACTYDHNTLSVFQNGQLVGSNVIGPATVVNTSSNIKLGSDDVGQQFYSGLIDEPMIFGRALSPAELQTIFNADNSGVCTSCSPLPSGMVSWWTGNNTPNDLIGTNHGTLMNGATYASGKVGQAFAFNGNNQHVEIPDSPSLRPVSGLTLDGWFKFNTSSPQAALISKPFVTGSANSYVIWVQDGTLYAGIGGGIVGVGFTPVPGQWYHIAYTYNDVSTQHRLIVDGVTVSATLQNSDLTYDSTALLIGMDKDNGSPVLALDGMADEVEIFGRELSITEIQAIVDAGSSGICHACSPPPSGMVAWWPGEDNAQDIKGPTFENGTLMNGTTFALGKVGKAFSFDGVDDYIEVPHSPELNLTSGLTLDTWFLQRTDGFGVLFSKSDFNGTESVTSYGVQITPGGSLNVALYGTYPADNWSTASGLVTAGRWYHIALTWDGTYNSANNVNLYLNGILVGSWTKSAAPLNVTSYSLTLGSMKPPTYYGKLNGMIDEPEIFNRALTQAEVQAIYNAGSAGKCNAACTTPPANLVDWWPANGNGNDVQGGLTATLANGASFSAGNVGQAFTFDGVDDYVSMPASSNWAFGSGDFSVEFWEYADGNVFRQPLVNNRSTVQSENEWAIEVYRTNNRVEIHSGYTILLTATNLLTPARWNHVAVTRTGGTLTIYINGVPSGSIANSNNFSDINDLQIGRDLLPPGPGDLAGPFQGKIDELSIYRRGLSAGEVTAIFNAGNAGKCLVACTQPPLGIVSWYRGDNNANDTISGFNGILENGATFGLGEVGQGFSFDGSDDKITIPHNAAQNTGSQITIDAWVNPSASGIGWSIFQKRSTSNVGGYVLEKSGINPDGLQFVLMINGSWQHLQSPPTALTNGVWQHVAGTYDGSMMRIYVNGIEVSNVAQTGAIDAVPDPAVIGINIVNQSFAWNGGIDEVGLFNRALTAAEIKSIYDAGSIGMCIPAATPTPTATATPTATPTVTPTATPTGTPTPSPLRSRADFDADGRTDCSVFRPGDGTWYVQQSRDGVKVEQFGLAGDIPAPGDFDNDGKTDIAIFRGDDTGINPDFYVLNSATSTVTYTVWGSTGDVPVVGDYDGDGRADYGIYRPSDSRWYVLKTTGGFLNFPFGIPGDKAMAFDYDGDGKADPAVFRPSTQTWYVAKNPGTPEQNFDAVFFGLATDNPVPADYDGDGKEDIAVFRPTDGMWWLRRSTAGLTAIQFGLPGDIPVPGDYDGDGKDDLGIYRGGVWFMLYSSNDLAYVWNFGLPSDVPIPNKYIP